MKIKNKIKNQDGEAIIKQRKLIKTNKSNQKEVGIKIKRSKSKLKDQIRLKFLLLNQIKIIRINIIIAKVNGAKIMKLRNNLLYKKIMH